MTFNGEHAYVNMSKLVLMKGMVGMMLAAMLHALPQTGTSLFAALAMALSGFALTIAGAWASLLGKNSRH